MLQAQIDETLLTLKRTRSHIINALDGTNRDSNVIRDIDHLVEYLNQNDSEEITQEYIDRKFRIIKGEINCSLDCFNNAMKALMK
ncbi:MAG: hypothetical protein M3005_03620 [Apilactobacillus sp.]|uniref:hypothetical protein n=1 Tax=Apilactobacillus TaxID=2767877 RepID=UPI0025D73D2F|nr:hypothetical protein [Apilactobacillus sp.]MCT6822945.1 hypothetical protein [Apilactobacillus sp.]MCT6858001.1 hypothetical protein [Apilactobacillus sp.]